MIVGFVRFIFDGQCYIIVDMCIFVDDCVLDDVIVIQVEMWVFFCCVGCKLVGCFIKIRVYYDDILQVGFFVYE